MIDNAGLSTSPMFSFGSKRHSSHSSYAHAPDAQHAQRHQTVKYPPGYQQQQQQHYAPPHGADPHLWQRFMNVDRDRSGSITVDELQGALVNGAQNLQ
jgi:hypothetical protein